MTFNSGYSHTTSPILEAWLIKALCLVYSKKPGDRDKLLKMYKDARDNESQIMQITLADAVKDVKDLSSLTECSADSQAQRDHPVCRIRPVQSVSAEIAPVVTCVCTPSSTTAVLSSATQSDAATERVGAKRNANGNKMAFFNIFDRPNSASTTVKTSTSCRTTSVSQDASNEDAPVSDLSTGSTKLTCPTNTNYPSIDTQTSLSSSSSLLNPIVADTTIDLTIGDDSVTFLPIIQTTNSHDDDVAESSTPPPNLFASLVADLACSACGRLTQQTQLEPDGKTVNANVLVECSQCGSLYHQLCHKPPILMQSHALVIKQHQQWLCSSCTSQSVQPQPTDVDGVVSKPNDATDSNPVTSTVNECHDIGHNSAVGARKRKSGFINASMIRKVKP